MAINQKRMGENREEGYKKEPELNEFIPEAGKQYMLRFLPRDMTEYLSPEGADDFAFIYRYHFNYLKADGTKLFNIPCPKTWGLDKQCDICAEGRELWNSPNEEDKKLSKKFYRNERALLNVFDLTDAASVAKGAQWYRAPIKKVYEEIRKLVINPAWAVNGKDILDLEHGRNFTLKVLTAKESGTGYVDYEVTPTPTSFDIRPYLTGDWEARINSLVTHKPKVSNEDIQKLLVNKQIRSDGNPPPPPGAVPGAVPPPPPPGAVPPPPQPSRQPNADNKEQQVNGGTPPPPPPPAVNSAPPPPPNPAPAPAQAAPAAPRSAECPECFGKKYAPRSAECVACKTNSPSVLQDCRKAYLSA